MPWSQCKSTLPPPLKIVLAAHAKMPAWEEVVRLCGVSWNTVRAAAAGAVKCGLERREA